MSKIGIFWIYSGRVIGRALNIIEGDEYVAGIIDSPDTHIDLWENNYQIINLPNELINTEYQLVPRGRVVYSKAQSKHIIYMDKTLFNNKYKQSIAHFFDITSGNISWKADFHYSTNSQEIDDLFNS